MLGSAKRRFELALEVQRWTRAHSECLPGDPKIIVMPLNSREENVPFRPKVTEIEWNWENVVYHTAVWPFMEEKQP